MKSDRLVVLVAPEEKARLVALAEARQSSVGELVREAVARLDAPRTAQGTQDFAAGLMRLGCEKVRDNDDGSQLWRRADGRHFLVSEHSGRFSRAHTAARVRATPADPEVQEPDAAAPASLPLLEPDQAAALERLADAALRTMRKANTALDQAFEEVEATKAYFAAKRRKAGGEA